MDRFIQVLINMFAHIDKTLPTVITGDLNVDLLKNTSDKQKLLTLMIDTLQYRQIIDVPTTDYKSCLDHIYTNFSAVVVACGVFESFYSDHKATWVTFQEIVNKTN